MFGLVFRLFPLVLALDRIAGTNTSTAGTNKKQQKKKSRFYKSFCEKTIDKLFLLMYNYNTIKQGGETMRTLTADSQKAADEIVKRLTAAMTKAKTFYNVQLKEAANGKIKIIVG